MIGQFIFFALFIMTFFAGVFVYFSPKQQALSLPQVVVNQSDDEMTEDSSIKEFQQLNVTTIKGIVQIRRQMDEMTQEQKKLIDMINEDQKELNNTNKNIAGILKQINGNNDVDVLKLKELGLQLKDDQRLLVDHGQALIDFNNQLVKSRQWFSKENDLLNSNNLESLRLMQQHTDTVNDQSGAYFANITQQNNDVIQHSQELIDEERQKAEDQQNR